MTAAQALKRVRALCLALPETSERLSHGTPTFFIRDKKTFVSFWDKHHGDGRVAIWCAAPAGMRKRSSKARPSTTSSRPTSAIADGSACGSTEASIGTRLQE